MVFTQFVFNTFSNHSQVNVINKSKFLYFIDDYIKVNSIDDCIYLNDDLNAIEQ